MKRLALFDFDHTLYNKNSLLEFTKSYHGLLYFYLGMIFLSPILIGFTLGLLTSKYTKQKFLGFYFKNESYILFCQKAARFSIQKIENDLNPKVFKSFKNHLANNDKVIIVTASAPEWILPWSSLYSATVIGTKLQVIDGKITGKLASENCNNAEKVNRILAVENLNCYDEIVVYGKGKGDREMLQLSKIFV